MSGFQLISILLLIQYVGVSHCGPNEKALLAYLFNTSREDAHNPQERPVLEDTKPLEVRFKITLAQIIDVDEKNQILKTSLWLDMKWRDYHFKWDPKNFGNITIINVLPTQVWKPDILMYNSADEKFDSTFATNVVADHTGLMLYVPPGMFSSTCTIDIQYFPFDRQTCIIKFGSWTFDGTFIDLKLQCEDDAAQVKVGNCTSKGDADLLSYVKSGEWTLLSARVQQHVERYDCCDVDYYDIKLHLLIQRRSRYYIFNLVIPCALISIIALLVFTLPPDAGEKISLGVTILLSLTMFLFLVASSLPQTSLAIPLISIYFSIIMMICSASLVCTVFVLNYHHRSEDGSKVPKFILVVVNKWLANCLFMKPPASSEKFEKDDASSPLMTCASEMESPSCEMGVGNRYGATNKNRFAQQLSSDFIPVNNSTGQHPACLFDVGIGELQSGRSQNNVNPDDDFRVIYPGGNSITSYSNNIGHHGANKHHNCDSFEAPNTGPTPHSSTPFCTTRRELDAILKELRFITKKIEDDEEDSNTGKQWKFAARVIDRLCLIFFSIFTLVSTLAILLSAHTLHDDFVPAEDSRTTD